MFAKAVSKDESYPAGKTKATALCGIHVNTLFKRKIDNKVWRRSYKGHVHSFKVNVLCNKSLYTLIQLVRVWDIKESFILSIFPLNFWYQSNISISSLSNLKKSQLKLKIFVTQHVFLRTLELFFQSFCSF